MFVGKKSRPRKPKQRHPRNTVTADGQGAPSHKEGDNKNPLRGPARKRSKNGLNSRHAANPDRQIGLAAAPFMFGSPTAYPLTPHAEA